MNANANERKIKCCSCFKITENYYFTAQKMCVIGCGSGIETWCKNCEDDLRENEADKIVRNIEQVDICKGCNCDIDDNGKCGKDCRFADYCGMWQCDECNYKNIDTEWCFKCGYLGNEKFANGADLEEDQKKQYGLIIEEIKKSEDYKKFAWKVCNEIMCDMEEYAEREKMREEEELVKK